MDPNQLINGTTHQSSATYDKNLGDSASILLHVWIYFNLIANNILLPILVLTILFSTRLRRHATFINLCLTWIFSGVFSLLLFYARQYKDSEPPRALCIAQSSLLFGISPMWSTAVLALFYYMYRTFQGQSQQTQFKRTTRWLMLTGPYISQSAFSIAALIISLRQPDQVSRRTDFFYCGLQSTTLTLARTIFVGICSGCTLIMEVLLMRIMYSTIAHLLRVSPTEAGVESIRSCLATLVRVVIFGIYVILGLAIDLVASTKQRSVLPQIYVATAGAFVFIVFGTQMDILRVWFPCNICRRRTPRRVSNRPYSTGYPGRLQASQTGININLDRLDRHQIDGRAHRSQTSSRPPSFTLDDLFPQYPEPARTVPMYYTHYLI